MNSNETPTPKINKIKNRLLYLSPTVQAGLEPECTKSDFFQEGGRALGKGAFGEVWKVTHKVTKKVYVIKVIRKKLIIDNKLIDQMNREIEIMYKLNHPHIIKLINHFEDDDCFYLVLDYAAKGQLYTILQRQKRFDEKTAAQFFRESVTAVKFIHSFDPPIIHRDIKPENILIDADGRVKLADFGWSNFANEQIRKTLCGTPEYLAPEMLSKSGHDTSVDVWSLGILLYEFLCGYSPFKGKTQEEVYSNIRRFKITFPDDFPIFAKDLVQRILKQKPHERIKIHEILEHTWLQKIEPLKPDLVVPEQSEKEILLSRLINIPEDVLANEKKVNKTKEIVSNIRMSSLAATSANSAVSEATENQLKSLLEQANVENNKLKAELNDIKMKINKNEADYKHAKNENARLTKLLEEFNKNKDELEKMKVINKDRLVLLTDIEEKNNEIFEHKNRIRVLENDVATLTRDNGEIHKKFEEVSTLNEALENKNIQLKNQLETAIKDNSSLSSQYQNKIEILQAKMIEKLNPEDTSNAGDKMNTLILETINDFKGLLKSKVDSLHHTLEEIKDDSEKAEAKLERFMQEKSDIFISTLRSIKSSFDNEVMQLKIRLDGGSKGNDRQDWLKKQINELMTFKLKCVTLESTISKLEKDIELLRVRLKDKEDEAEIKKKVATDFESLLKKQLNYVSNIEAKLSDVKDFVFKNCSDKLDELEKLL